MLGAPAQFRSGETPWEWLRQMAEHDPARESQGPLAATGADAAHAAGRLLARPRAAPRERAPDAGVHALRLGSGRDALLRVPDRHPPREPLPLVVMLHGAGGDARGALALVRGEGFGDALVLAPESRGSTWDVIANGLGPDVAFLDRALEDVFARFAVDPARVALAGFSDGASYALTLAVANGSLFPRTIAFSPGFAAPPSAEGGTRIWISHGTGDPVLPIDRCSRRLVPRLRAAGLAVEYREFDGGHAMPAAIVREAWRWLSGR
jgi:phospholipase/carboxylesterase